jgi:imidazolonepropionase-like amidohydrolase
MAGYRQAFMDARDYRKQWDAYENGGRRGDAPSQNLRNETLAGVMRGDITVNIHCYRADEMAQMIDLSKEFGFKISSFHHGVEAYKISDVLAREGICGALWADWWGFKLEAFDGIEENIALVDKAAGGCAIVHSDSSEGVQRLNQEAAKVIASAKRVNIDISPEQAMRWLSYNAAKALRIEDKTGSLAAGKMADVVVWNGTPFSSYAKAEQVYIDGALMFERGNPALQPKADFMLGQEAQP